MDSAIIAVVVLIAGLLVYLRLRRGLSHPGGVPRVGGPGVFNYLRTAFRYTFDALSVIQEGRLEFEGGPFVIPTLSGPVFLLPPKYLDLIKFSSDEVFNQSQAVGEDLQLSYTMNPDQMENPYHATAVRAEMSRSIPMLMSEINAETAWALQKTFPNSDGEATVQVYPTMLHMVGLISNRVVLGSDLGRNEEFINTMVKYAENMIFTATFIHWSPFILRPVTYWLMSSLLGGKKDVLKFLTPSVERYLKEREAMEEKPILFAEFLIKAAPPGEPVEKLAMRVLHLNFGAIHTSAIFLTQALFELALLSEADRELIRAEVRAAVISEGGWNRSAMSKFHMIDSALREIGRVYGMMHFAVPRLALQDHHFGDGTKIPAGYRVAIDMKAVHFNPEIYEEPNRCDLFRFSKLRKGTDADSKLGFSSVDTNYLPFGAGRHTCPGRVFAAMELKVILAHVLLDYNFSFPMGRPGRPDNILFNGANIPDTKAVMVFTKRS